MSSQGDRPRRPGTMSDDERALVGAKKRRTTPLGVPIMRTPTPEDFDSFTPINDVLPLLPDDPALMTVIESFWRHTANMELRFRERAKENGASELRMRVESLELGMVDVRGESGNNGRLGNVSAKLSAVKDAVDKILSRAWWAFSVVAAGVGGAAVKLVIVGKSYGELESTVAQMKRQLEQHELELYQVRQSHRSVFSPAEDPGKATP